MFKNLFPIKFLLPVLVLIFNTIITAQERSLYFQLFTIEEGLSQNTIYAIVQDKKDFIWLATQNGLNRFDGYSFKIWNHNKNNPNTLTSGFINSLAVDKFNRIWIATITGINSFVQDKNIFLYFDKSKNKLSDNYVNDVFIDSKGFLWAATQNGLNRSANVLTNTLYDTNLVFIQYLSNKKTNSISNNTVNCIYQDNYNTLWFGTQNGLNKYNQESNDFEHYFFNENNIYHKENNINSIIHIKDDIYWIATNNGLFELNARTKKISKTSNSTFFTKNKINGIFTKIFKQENGDVWIGMKDYGLLLYDNKRKKFTHYTKNTKSKNALSSNHVLSVFVDKSSAIFVGTRYGLNISKTNTNCFVTYHYLGNSSTISKNISAVSMQTNDSVWMGTYGGGLILFNPIKNTFKHFNLADNSKSMSEKTVYAIVANNQNQLWLGTLKNGLFLFNHKNNKYTHFTHSKKKNSISNNSIFSLIKQGDSILWIGTWGNGIDKLNLKTGVFKNFSLNGTNIDKILVSNIKLDKNNNLWITTWGKGVIQFDTKTNKLTTYKNHPKQNNSISSNYVLISYFDKDYIWFGTASGLNKFDRKTKEFTYFGKNIGFKDEFINSIEKDKHNNLWLSTNKGIVKFNITIENIINFDFRDGLQNNEFNSRANTKLPDGRIIFGGISGFNIFHPDSVHRSKFTPNIVITAFQLFYKNISAGKKYHNNFVLKKNIEETDTLILNYKNNVIGFEFTALDYSKPDMIKYAFRLKGFETHWNKTNHKDRFARYTNLSAGKYVLQIKATNSDGVWSPHIKELVIIIKAPFWLTPKFWIILAVLLIFSGFIIYKVRTNLLIMQKKKLESLVLEQTKEIQEKNNHLKEKYEELVAQEEEIREQALELQVLTEQLKDYNTLLSDKVKKRTIELEKALEKVENSQKLVSSFLANLSHEIRTPVNAIMGFAQIIGSTDLDEGERDKFVSIIEQNAQSLINQIDSIIDVSRLHTQQYHFHNIVFLLYSELILAYNDFNMKIKTSGKNSKLILNIKQKIQLNADKYSFNKIVFHLLDNAVKYTDKGTVEFGYIIDETQFDENKVYKIDKNSKLYLELFVKDTGIGISETKQKIIFEAFQKVEDTHKKYHRGIGLGLTLVKHLTMSMSGIIHVKSKLNSGTEISIKFPISEI